MKIAVLGGGLAGVAFAYEASRLGHRVVLIEREGKLGGLLRSEDVDGFLFDTGGSHVLFSRDNAKVSFLARMLGGNFARHRRDARIYFEGKFVKYPFENGLYMLPPEFRFRALRDVVYRYVEYRCGGKSGVSNFEEWIYATFGETIADSYLIPYNRKLWKRDLREISLEWVGGRVPNPPLEDILRSSVGIPTEGYLHQLNFIYPRRGGIQELVNVFAERMLKMGNVSIRLGQKVVGIDAGKNTVQLSNGDEVKCDRIVSSLPLPEAFQAAGLKWVPRLDYNSLVVVGLGIRDTQLPKYHWVYFPGEETVFHRVAFLSNYSPSMAPRNCANIIAEISVRPGTQVDLERHIELTIEGLEALGMIKRGKIVAARAWYWKYAYVVYDKNYAEAVARARRALEEIGMTLIGRFGRWSYMNMDDVIFQAFEAAHSIGTPTRSYSAR